MLQKPKITLYLMSRQKNTKLKKKKKVYLVKKRAMLIISYATFRSYVALLGAVQSQLPVYR